ncbi:MAG: hypothetical protein HQ527_01955 [Cyanobacteria bacterium]|nr:hypothetical protein [Cyanobacteria bacterium bin.51]
MRTQDREQHDNLYAEEGTIQAGETSADAQSHAVWAVAAIALMVAVLGISLILT